MQEELNKSIEKVLNEIFKDLETVNELRKHNQDLIFMICAPIKYGFGYVCATEEEVFQLKEVLRIKLDENNFKIQSIL